MANNLRLQADWDLQLIRAAVDDALDLCESGSGVSEAERSRSIRYVLAVCHLLVGTLERAAQGGALGAAAGADGTGSSSRRPIGREVDIRGSKIVPQRDGTRDGDKEKTG